MRCAVSVLLFCVICAPAVQAGAWLREHKTAFTAVGATIRGSSRVPLDYETKFYLEYGLAPRLTLGFDYNETPGTSGHALMFARLPVGPPGGRTRYAVELGAGGHHWQGQWSAMYKATFAVGRGFATRWGNGWVAAETAYERRTGLPDPALKLDAVAGLSSGPRLRPLFKLETAYVRGQPFSWSLTPGIMFDIGKSTWVLGLERKSAGQATVGLTLGLWRSF